MLYYPLGLPHITDFDHKWPTLLHLRIYDGDIFKPYVLGSTDTIIYCPFISYQQELMENREVRYMRVHSMCRIIFAAGTWINYLDAVCMYIITVSLLHCPNKCIIWWSTLLSIISMAITTCMELELIYTERKLQIFPMRRHHGGHL